MSKSRRSLAALASLLAAAATLAACGDDATAPALTVTATAAVEGEPAVLRMQDGTPYLQCVVGVTAVTTGSGEGEWIGATLRWYAGVERAQPFDSATLGYSEVVQGWREGLNLVPGQPRTSRWQMSATVPFYGDIELRYRRRGGSARSTTASFRCGPSIPPGAAAPAITALTADAPAGPLEVGDTITVTYTATSPASIWRSAVSLQGACDTLVDFVEPLATSTTRAVRIALPPRCQLGVPLEVGVAVLDGGARTATRSLATGLWLTDVTPPTVFPLWGAPANGTGTPLEGTRFVGDSLVVVPNARDASGVRWLVWEVLPSMERDSVPVTDTTSRVWLPVRASWTSMTGLRLRARDAVGLESEWAEASRGSLFVGGDRPRASRSMAVSGGIDWATPDARRNVLYVQQQGDSRVRVIDLATMAVARTIDIGAGGGFAMDITAGGDSLLVALPSARALGVIDLRAATPAVAQLPLGFDAQAPVYSMPQVMAMANGHALVRVEGGSGVGTQLLDVDLATGAVTTRADAPGNVPLARSLDHRVLVAQGGSAFARWTTASDAFTVAPAPARIDGALAVDGTGATVATSRHVYDAGLAWLRELQSPFGACICTIPVALSPDGAHLYYSAFGGIVRTRTSDGRLLDRTRITVPPPPDVTGWHSAFLLTMPGSERVIYVLSRPTASTPTGMVPASGAVVVIE